MPIGPVSNDKVSPSPEHMNDGLWRALSSPFLSARFLPPLRIGRVFGARRQHGATVGPQGRTVVASYCKSEGGDEGTRSSCFYFFELVLSAASRRLAVVAKAVKIVPSTTDLFCLFIASVNATVAAATASCSPVRLQQISLAPSHLGRPRSLPSRSLRATPTVLQSRRRYTGRS